MTEKILLVDDDANLLAGLRRQLRHRLEVQTAQGGYAGLEALASDGPFSVVVSDMRMPVMNGIRFLARVKERHPDTVRMMLTGDADMEVAVQAVNEGNIFHFLTKPCGPEALLQALQTGIRQYRLIIAERELLEKTLNGSIRVLTEILSTAAPEIFGRAQQIRDQVRKIAERLSLSNVWELEIAAMLSPIGYMTVPSEMQVRISRGISLSDEERNLLLNIPEIGSSLLANIPRMESIARIIRYHTRRFDASDADPDGIVGQTIPLGSRILKVVADLIALRNKGKTKPEAIATMQGRLGWYDPDILAALAASEPGASLAASGTPPTPLALTQLYPGLTLAADVETTDGKLVIAAGNTLSGVTVQRLKNFARVGGIRQPIYVMQAE